MLRLPKINTGHSSSSFSNSAGFNPVGTHSAVNPFESSNTEFDPFTSFTPNLRNNPYASEYLQQTGAGYYGGGSTHHSGTQYYGGASNQHSQSGYYSETPFQYSGNEHHSEASTQHSGNGYHSDASTQHSGNGYYSNASIPHSADGYYNEAILPHAGGGYYNEAPTLNLANYPHNEASNEHFENNALVRVNSPTGSAEGSSEGQYFNENHEQINF